MTYLKKHANVHQYPVNEMDTQLLNLSDYNASTMRNCSQVISSQVPSSLMAMIPDIERRQLNRIREFYYQQRERLSAFQFVQQQTIDKMNKRYFCGKFGVCLFNKWHVLYKQVWRFPPSKLYGSVFGKMTTNFPANSAIAKYSDCT